MRARAHRQFARQAADPHRRMRDPAIQRPVGSIATTLKCRAGGLTELWVQRGRTIIRRASSGRERVAARRGEPGVSQRRDRRLQAEPDHARLAARRGLLCACARGHHRARRRAGRTRGRAHHARNWLFDEIRSCPGESRMSGEIDGLHHMGTTRMATDPARGVVDTDCRVHGIDNLYIGGSSVFPTGGWPIRPTRSCRWRCGWPTISIGSCGPDGPSTGAIARGSDAGVPGG